MTKQVQFLQQHYPLVLISLFPQYFHKNSHLPILYFLYIDIVLNYRVFVHLVEPILSLAHLVELLIRVYLYQRFLSILFSASGMTASTGRLRYL